MEKISLWPTDIYEFKNETIDNNKIKELILQKEKENEFNKNSLLLLTEDCFSEIKNFLFECLLSIKNEIYTDDVKFRITESWANVRGNGDYSPNHIHPNSHWSCAYYVTETYEAPIFFIDPRTRAQMFMPANKYLGAVGPEKKQPGDVIFFPSWLEHGVKKISTDNIRICISCNFLIEG